MTDRGWAFSVLRTVPIGSILLLTGCASMLGYSAGRMVDTHYARATPPPACTRHPLHEGQRVTLVLDDGVRREGVYLWHDCTGESLLVLKTDVMNPGVPGSRADTLRVPLRSIDHIDVPRKQARYVGLVLGLAGDALVGLSILFYVGMAIFG